MSEVSCRGCSCHGEHGGSCSPYYDHSEHELCPTPGQYGSSTPWSSSGRNFPARGAAFNSSMVVAVPSWAAMGGRPADWERYSLFYDDEEALIEKVGGAEEWAKAKRFGVWQYLGAWNRNTIAQNRISNGFGSLPTSWSDQLLDVKTANNSGGEVFVEGGAADMVFLEPYNTGKMRFNGSSTPHIAIIQPTNANAVEINGGNVVVPPPPVEPSPVAPRCRRGACPCESVLTQSRASAASRASSYTISCDLVCVPSGVAHHQLRASHHPLT